MRVESRFESATKLINYLDKKFKKKLTEQIYSNFLGNVAISLCFILKYNFLPNMQRPTLDRPNHSLEVCHRHAYNCQHCQPHHLLWNIPFIEVNFTIWVFTFISNKTSPGINTLSVKIIIQIGVLTLKRFLPPLNPLFTVIDR